MRKRIIGNLQVSEIGMGCMGFSHGYGEVPAESYSIQAIQKAYEYGCTFFDTAEGYGAEMFFPGHNEQLLGKAVESFRNHISLASKFYIRDEEVQCNKSLYDVVRSHLELSLFNLKTDYLDLYYLHRVNENISVDSIAEIMGRLIRDGLIRNWGLSQVSKETLEKAHKVTPVAAVQNLYSILERDSETDIFPFCLSNSISVIPFSPVGSGFLSGKINEYTKFAGDDVRKFVPQLSKENIIANQPIIELIKTFSEEKNATNAQISLAWMLYKYPNVIPIPGSKKHERILENLAASEVIMTKTEFENFEVALNKIPVYGHRGHIETQQTSFGKNWSKKIN